MLTDRAVRRVAGAVAGLCLLAAGPVAACSGDDGSPSAQETPAGSAPPALAPLEPMKQPTKPFQVEKLPKQNGSTELDSIKYGLSKVVWVSLGTIPDSTRPACTIQNDDLVAIKAKASKSFACALVTGTKTTTGAGGKKKTTISDEVRTWFTVRATRSGSSIDWTYAARKLPVSETKIEHEAVRQADDPARVTCVGHGTMLLWVGDPDAVHCYVTHPDNSQTSYFGGLDTKGALTFATAKELERRKDK